MKGIKVSWNTKRDGRVSLLVEQLRYAGLVGSINEKYKDDEDSFGTLEFIIYPSSGVRESVWAEQNTARMRSFSIKAEVVD